MWDFKFKSQLGQKFTYQYICMMVTSFITNIFCKSRNIVYVRLVEGWGGFVRWGGFRLQTQFGQKFTFQYTYIHTFFLLAWYILWVYFLTA